MVDVLANPVWAALTGAHAHLARVKGQALRYPADMSMFVAFADDATEQAWADLVALVEPGELIALTGPALLPPPAGWEVRTITGVQLTPAAHSPATALSASSLPAPSLPAPSLPAPSLPAPSLPAPSLPASSSPAPSLSTSRLSTSRLSAGPSLEVVRLGDRDVPEMLDLVARADPGPFAARTIELGRYFGIRDGGALVAMAGERMRLPGWGEISTVCTADTHRGRGLATVLVEAVAAGIRERADTPFLHVASSNLNAIRLYRTLGFTQTRETAFYVVRRKG